jgi:hypothetical protein
MEAVRTSETSVDNHFTLQYIQEDNSEHHTRRRENFKSHKNVYILLNFFSVLFCISAREVQEKLRIQKVETVGWN